MWISKIGEQCPNCCVRNFHAKFFPISNHSFVLRKHLCMFLLHWNPKKNIPFCFNLERSALLPNVSSSKEPNVNPEISDCAQLSFARNGSMNCYAGKNGFYVFYKLRCRMLRTFSFYGKYRSTSFTRYLNGSFSKRSRVYTVQVNGQFLYTVFTRYSTPKSMKAKEHFRLGLSLSHISTF